MAGVRVARFAGPGGDPFALPEIPDGREAPAVSAAYVTYPFAPDATFGGPYGASGLDVIRGGLIGGDAVAMRSATLGNGDVVTAGGRTLPVFSCASWTWAASLVRDPAIGLRLIDFNDALCGTSSCSARSAPMAAHWPIFARTG